MNYSVDWNGVGERDHEQMTEAERTLLHLASLRPNGFIVRGQEEKATLLRLAERRLVCDPHDMRGALFTKITTEGKAALAATS